MAAPLPARSLLLRQGFPDLLRLLRDDAYRQVRPTVRDGAIVHDEIGGIGDLPAGWTEVQEAGAYRLERRGRAGATHPAPPAPTAGG